jgi:hypothetical protein
MFTTSAKSAAATILSAVKSNKRRVLIGADAYGIDLMARTMPAFYQRLVTMGVRRNAKLG